MEDGGDNLLRWQSTSATIDFDKRESGLGKNFIDYGSMHFVMEEFATALDGLRHSTLFVKTRPARPST